MKPATTAATLTLDKVRHAYDGPWIIDGISGTFSLGETWVIRGPSGSGKSTLLRVMAGLIPPREGSVSLTPSTTMSMVFQDQALWPHLTAEQHLTLVLKSRIANKRRRTNEARDWLDTVGLAALANRLPEELSGGERQRLALARAVATRPHILLLDEPFNHLDAERAADAAEMIRSIFSGAGHLVVCVTHDQPDMLGDAHCVRFTPTELVDE